MFQTNFDDFSESGHHRNRPRASKVENRARMTSFCTRNTHTMFGVQFLSSLVITAKKCFSQILMTFPCPDTTGTRLEQTKFKTDSDDSVLLPKHTHNVWGVVLIVSRQYDGKIFRSNFDDFFGPKKHQSRKS